MQTLQYVAGVCQTCLSFLYTSLFNVYVKAKQTLLLVYSTGATQPLYNNNITQPLHFRRQEYECHNVPTVSYRCFFFGTAV